MKIRTKFVSNSSSSSFIIIKNTKDKELQFPENGKGVIKVPYTFGGETEFANSEKFTDFGSKLNFAVMIARDIDFETKRGFLDSDYVDFDYYDEDDNKQTTGFWSKNKMSDLIKPFSVNHFETLSAEYPNGLLEKIKYVVNKKLGEHNWEFYLVDSYDDKIDYVAYNDIYKNKKWTLNEKTVQFGHIDHGANWYENPAVLEIFTTEENLRNFLFNRDSVLEIGY